MNFPEDYIERVYAGVLGKIIGVYMGRPIEGWSHKKIMKEIGEIWYYCHDKVGVPLLVTDDDIAGTFTFLRALEDIEAQKEPESSDIADAWLNYLIEGRTILWWGGKGVSTEHTAFLSLKDGFYPPESGSINRNGKVVAEQIGSQIFIDGWAMVSPGSPDLASRLAEKASLVSHDGEAVFGAVIIAVMESLAFVCDDTIEILNKALKYIPQDSTIAVMNRYLIDLYKRESDWHKGWEEFSTIYNYNTYPGVCPIVPNHGLVVLSILYGENDFQKTQMIVNTCGWDTDCNAANAGCFMGIKLGLKGIDAEANFRNPVNDVMYLPTADGGRSINDAVQATYRIVNAARRLAGLDPVTPKNNARFHFNLQGSTQGFHVESQGGGDSVPLLSNRKEDDSEGERVLSCSYINIGRGQNLNICTDTFIPVEARDMAGYEFIASPTLYAGQTIKARLRIKEGSEEQEASIYLQVNDFDDKLHTKRSKKVLLISGSWEILTFKVPETNGQPVVNVGIELSSKRGGRKGELQLDWLTWSGTPESKLLPQVKPSGREWIRAWVDGVDQVDTLWNPGIRLSSNSGKGLFFQGTEEWSDYKIKANIQPHLFTSGGICFGVKGMKRFLTFEITNDQKARICRYNHDEGIILAETNYPFVWENKLMVSISFSMDSIKVKQNNKLLISADLLPSDNHGGCGLFLNDGSLTCLEFSIGSSE